MTEYQKITVETCILNQLVLSTGTDLKNVPYVIAKINEEIFICIATDDIVKIIGTFGVIPFIWKPIIKLKLFDSYLICISQTDVMFINLNHCTVEMEIKIPHKIINVFTQYTEDNKFFLIVETVYGFYSWKNSELIFLFTNMIFDIRNEYLSLKNKMSYGRPYISKDHVLMDNFLTTQNFLQFYGFTNHKNKIMFIYTDLTMSAILNNIDPSICKIKINSKLLGEISPSIGKIKINIIENLLIFKYFESPYRYDGFVIKLSDNQVSPKILNLCTFFREKKDKNTSIALHWYHLCSNKKNTLYCFAQIYQKIQIYKNGSFTEYNLSKYGRYIEILDILEDTLVIFVDHNNIKFISF